MPSTFFCSYDVFSLSSRVVLIMVNMIRAMPRVHRTVMDMVLTRTQRLVLSRRRRNSARKMDCVIGMALPVLMCCLHLWSRLVML